MIAPTRTLSSLKPGDTLPPASKTFSTSDLVAYGAATWDWHRLHYDAAYAKSVGLPSVLLDGQSFGAIFARHALDWLGPRAFITRLSFRMRSMAFAGDTLSAEGEVSEVRREADHDVIVLAQRLRIGERLAADASTIVRLPKA
jgi:acyl dehydratase